MNDNVNNENMPTNNSTPQSRTTTPGNTPQFGAPTGNKELESEETANNSELQTVTDASNSHEQQGVYEVGDDDFQGGIGDYGDEEYFPEAYDPNTRYGQYKSRQEQLQREAEAIKQRQLQRAERNKNKNSDEEDNNDKEPSTSKKADEKPSNNSSNNTEKNNDEKDNDKKDNKLQSKVDKVGGKIDNVKSKVNQAKQTVNKVTHPVSAAKDEIKNKLKKKLVEFLIHWWWVVAIAALFIILLLIVSLLFLGFSDSYSELMLDPRYDIAYTTVTSTNDYKDDEDKMEIEDFSLSEYALGAAYYEFKGKLDGKSDAEILEIYKTYFIVVKSLLLSYGEYDSKTKHIYIRNSYSEIPSCNIYYGCNIYQYDGSSFFVSSNYDAETIPGQIIGTVEEASSNERKLLMNAYEEVKYLLLLPKWFDAILTDYYFERPDYNSSIGETWINSNEKYDKKIKNTSEYENFKIYDLRQYIVAYASGPSDSYWWPIGSAEEINGIYGGEPIYTVITSKFTASRTIDGVTKAHNGVDIGKDGACVTNDYVIIASRPGTVIATSDGCPDAANNYANKYGCNSFGNYVKIDHGDGVITVYGHLRNGSVSVEEDQYVYQGQKLGVMGTSGSSTGCHLHFGIMLNGAYVDPLNYVSIDNPRPTGEIDWDVEHVGSNNKQTVCLNLKNSGFSNNAIAAIMTNIEAESSFNPAVPGDNGASYGLCQWHNERRYELENACGRDETVSPGMFSCQLEFLFHELQDKSAYQSVYKKLLSNSSAEEMANYFCLNFEIPKDKEITCEKRSKGAEAMLEYVKNGCN